jgi:hypothetical protein
VLELAQFTLLNQGLVRDGAQSLEELRQLAPNDPAPLMRIIVAALHWDGDAQAAHAAATRLRLLLSDVAPGERVHATCALAQWDAAQGQPHDVLLQSLQAHINDTTPSGVAAAVCVPLVRATEALRTQRGMTEAARALNDVTVNGPAAAGGPILNAANLVLARLYEASGDHAAALRVVRRRLLLPATLWYQTTRRREEGRLAELNGDRALAIQSYTEFLRLREPGSPGYDDVNRALQRLTVER